jgi:hypothetical protein
MELRNAISKGRLDTLRPLPLSRSFDWTDVSAGSISLGLCPAGHLVDKTVVEITSAFDGAVTLTVGDAIARLDS